MRGTQQVLAYGVETVYGTMVEPAAAFGIVTGGKVDSKIKVYAFPGTESKQVIVNDYGSTEYGGSCTLLLGDTVALWWAVDRGYASGPLPSLTLDGGVSINSSVPPTRMSGCKCNSMTLQCDGKWTPITLELDWIGQKLETASFPSYTPMPTGVYWAAVGGSLTLDGVPLASYDNFSLKVNNNLKPKYLANRQAADPRCLAWIDEGVQEISLEIKSDLMPAALVQGWGVEEPIDIVFQAAYLTEGEPIYFTITAHNCCAKSREEPLTPLKTVEFTKEFTAQYITYAQ